MNLTDMSSSLRAGAAAIIATTGLALATAPPAHAGSFHTLGFNYYNVKSNDGWSVTADGAGGGFVSTGMDTLSMLGVWNVGGGRSTFQSPDHTTFTFRAPAGTAITGATWTEHVAGLAGGDWNVVASDENQILASQVPASDHDVAVTRPVTGSTLVLRLQCGGPGWCRANPNARFAVEATDVLMSDEHPPEYGALAGQLADVSTDKISGVSPVTFRATDVGAGVRFVHIYDDGVDHVTLIDSNNNACADSTNGLRMYARRVPCLLSATASASLDTTTLADGNHTIKVTLEDAAGNTSTVLESKTKVVANHPPVNTAIPRIDKTEASFDSYAAPRVGQPITFSSAGSWSGPNLALAQAWFRCSASSGHCEQIPGAGELSYVPTIADVGYTLQLRSTASNVAGTVTAQSLPSGEVTAPKSAGDVVDKPAGGTNGANGANGANGLNGAANAVILPGLPSITNNTNNSATHDLIGRVVGQEPGVACPADRATLRFEHVSGGRVHLRYGRASTAQLELTCTTTGKPIADAKLEIATKTGTRPTVAADVTTDGAGHATIRLAKGASRGITVGYRMYSDDVIARAVATLKVLVDARVSIKANRKHLHNDQAVTLRGGLSGGAIPKRGVTLSVQWKDGKRWRPFAQIKTNKSGKYAYAYRFTRSNRTVAYRLRVLIAGGQIDYPYVAVASKSVRVTVGR